MKKHVLQFMAISGICFFTACSDSGKENEPGSNPGTKSTTVQTADSVKKTTISVGPDGAGVSTKSTDVQVNSSGVKVGTKDVKVDVKTRK